MEEETEIVESEEIPLYEPGEIPPYWQDTINHYGIKIMKLAMTFGLIVPEYTMRDYVEHAIESKSGYELIDIWGQQGARKSCRSLIISHWIYQDWDAVLKEIVLTPDAQDLRGYEDRGFLQKIKTIEKGSCIPLLIWDDWTVGLPSASFRTDIEQYAAIDAAWAAIRTKIKVVVGNNPLIDRLPRNIRDNISMEVFLGRNQVELIERFVRLPGLKQLECNFFKVQVEPLHQFNWRYVPTDVFKQYHNLRLEIAEYAIQKMGKAFKDEASLLQDMMTPFQAIAETGLAPTTFSDMLKRNIIPNEKINGKPYIRKTDIETLKQLMEKPGFLRKAREAKEKSNKP